MILASAVVSVQAAPEPPAPTFTRDIAPVLFNRCSGCHRPGEAAPFSLLNYDDARAHARQIVEATKRRYMPPWKPDPTGVELADTRRLPDEDIARIERWVALGMPEGRAADLPARPTFEDGWQFGRPDLVVALDRAFELPADGPDVIRNFVLPIPVSERRYVTALEFRPGNARVAHHATMLVDETRASRELDEADPKPGYEGILPYSARQPDGHFLGWTPGQAAIRTEPDMAWTLNAGSDLVVSVHMRPSGKAETIQFSVGLFFTSVAPRRIPFIVQLGKQDLDIPAGDAAWVTTDEYTLPVDVEVRGIQPHAHYLCREVEGTARLPDGSTRTLIRISDWDFAWQAQYRLATPLPLPKGTVLAMRFVYDNSAGNPRNPASPPRRVRYGQDSDDEMAELLVQLLPLSDASRSLLGRDFHVKATRDAIAGYETMIGAHPDRVNLHNDLAMLFLEAGEPIKAVVQFAEVARLRPGRAEPHYNLGVAYGRAGRWDAAAGAYRKAIELEPGYSRAHGNLGALLAQQGSRAAAREHYAKALEADPRNADAHASLGAWFQSGGDAPSAAAEYRRALDIDPAHAQALNGLGVAFQATGGVEQALASYRRALAAAPDYAEARLNLATALQLQDRLPEAIAHYRLVMEQRADWPVALQRLAAALLQVHATPQEADEALGIAQRADRLTNHRNPLVLDTLAAALAASGRYADAVAAETDALALLSGPESAAFAAEVQKRLDLYRRQQEK